jgi:hypothetical protein
MYKRVRFYKARKKTSLEKWHSVLCSLTATLSPSLATTFPLLVAGGNLVNNSREKNVVDLRPVFIEPESILRIHCCF